MPEMKRMIFLLDQDQRKRAEDLAWNRRIKTYTAVVREAIELWIAREEMREEIEDNIDLMFSDEKDLDAGVELAYKTYKLMKAGK